jgi:hypothetical protein
MVHLSKYNLKKVRKNSGTAAGARCSLVIGLWILWMDQKSFYSFGPHLSLLRLLSFFPQNSPPPQVSRSSVENHSPSGWPSRSRPPPPPAPPRDAAAVSGSSTRGAVRDGAILPQRQPRLEGLRPPALHTTTRCHRTPPASFTCLRSSFAARPCSD